MSSHRPHNFLGRYSCRHSAALLFGLDGLLRRFQLRIEMFHRILPAIVHAAFEIKRFILSARRLADDMIHGCRLVGAVLRNSDGFRVRVEHDSHIYTSL